MIILDGLKKQLQMEVEEAYIPQRITNFIRNIPQFDTCFGLFYPQSVTCCNYANFSHLFSKRLR
jgi:hypothetical protein